VLVWLKSLPTTRRRRPLHYHPRVHRWIGLIGRDLVNTGRVGWWIGRALVVLAFLVKSGRPEPASRMRRLGGLMVLVASAARLPPGAPSNS